jgi:precorrin-6B methylase 2
MNEYDSIAEWYDAYVPAGEDVRYFQDAARDATATLDLMAGTGRVSLAMVAATDGTVTCVDRSIGMLRQLSRKAPGRARLRIVCADVCALPHISAFDLVVIPFNSLAEVGGHSQHRQVIAGVWKVLIPGGRFLCTLHNPNQRRRTLDGRSRVVGTFSLLDQSLLEVTVTGSLDADGRSATSHQVYRRLDQTGATIEQRTQTVQFTLIMPGELLELAENSGFKVEALYGGYDGAAFDPDTSPFMIGHFQRPSRGAGSR